MSRSGCHSQGNVDSPVIATWSVGRGSSSRYKATANWAAIKPAESLALNGTKSTSPLLKAPQQGTGASATDEVLSPTNHLLHLYGRQSEEVPTCSSTAAKVISYCAYMFVHKLSTVVF